MRSSDQDKGSAGNPSIYPIASGMTSVVHRTPSGRIVKKLTSRDSAHFDRELFWLKELSGTGIAPEIVSFDRETRTIEMTDCGEPISRSNIPPDWRAQLMSALTALDHHNCQHNDLSEREILVKDGKVSLVDFGAATAKYPNPELPEYVTRLTKSRVFADRNIVEIIELLFGHGFETSEPHCIVLWDATHHEEVVGYLHERFSVLQEILFFPEGLLKKYPTREAALGEFYCGRASGHGEKATRPFYVYFVMDPQPRYERRDNVFNGRQSVVNVNIFDLKQLLRKGRTGFLHGSDTLQEAFDNFEALSIYKDGPPLCYANAWRPMFEDADAFFDRLNGCAGLDYVVMRNSEEIVDIVSGRKNGDIDLLVNDYFLFKQAAGAKGFKHKYPRWNIKLGPALEYEGYKVAGHVKIGQKEVTCDIRHLGDGYFDECWQMDMLQGSILDGKIKVLTTESHFYALTYHALAHKQALPEKYRPVLTEQARKLGIFPSNGTQFSDAELWEILDGYMVQNGYSYTRCDELSIPFGARQRLNIEFRQEIELARAFAKEGKLLHAKDILRNLVNDTDGTIGQALFARFLLWRTRLQILRGGASKSRWQATVRKATTKVKKALLCIRLFGFRTQRGRLVTALNNDLGGNFDRGQTPLE